MFDKIIAPVVVAGIVATAGMLLNNTITVSKLSVMMAAQSESMEAISRNVEQFVQESYSRERGFILENRVEKLEGKLNELGSISRSTNH